MDGVDDCLWSSCHQQRTVPTTTHLLACLFVCLFACLFVCLFVFFVSFACFLVFFLVFRLKFQFLLVFFFQLFFLFRVFFFSFLFHFFFHTSKGTTQCMNNIGLFSEAIKHNLVLKTHKKPQRRMLCEGKLETIKFKKKLQKI